MEKTKFVLSSTPHIRANDSTQSIMFHVLLALMPATLVGIWFFGINALITVALAVGSAVLFEYLYQKLTKQAITISDYSAAITGLLLALNLPAEVRMFVPIVGSFVAIVICKQIFGGLGQNFINPALAGRAFLMASYPVDMTNYTSPVASFTADGVSSATVLSQLNEGLTTAVPLMPALIGNVGGTIGETSALAILAGGIYLMAKKIIDFKIPCTFILTTFVITLLFSGQGIENSFNAMFYGGLFLGAFFMATDYVSSPVTTKGKYIFAFGCGVLTAVIRIFGSYPEGVSYSILLMNLAVPLIDRYTRPQVFGVTKVKKSKEVQNG